MTNRKSGPDTGDRAERGRFGPGNPGKPQGARNKATLAVEQLMEGEAEALSRKAVDLALAGDTGALRLCIDRIAPARRDRAVAFAMPEIKTAADHPAAIAAIITAVSVGDLAPSEADALTRMFAEHRKSLEIADLEARIARLEGAK